MFQARRTELWERKRSSSRQHLLRGKARAEQKLGPVFASLVAVWHLNRLWQHTLNLRGKHDALVWASVPTGWLWSHGAFPLPPAPLPAHHIVNLCPAQAIGHTSPDPFFPRRLLSRNTGLLLGSFLHSGVPFPPWRSLAYDQTLWWEPLPVGTQTFPLIRASPGISFPLFSKAECGQTQRRNIDSSGVHCREDYSMGGFVSHNIVIHFYFNMLKANEQHIALSYKWLNMLCVQYVCDCSQFVQWENCGQVGCVSWFFLDWGCPWVLLITTLITNIPVWIFYHHYFFHNFTLI